MSHIISDGTGKGNKAKVDENNRLFVKPFPTNIHSRSQETGRAYNTYFKKGLTAQNSSQPIAVVEYNGPGRMVISEMTFSLSLSNADYQFARFEIHINPTNVSGGVVRDPIGLNRGLLIPSDAVLLSGDDDTLVATDASVISEMFHCQLSSNGSSTYTWIPQDSFLLEKGDSFVVTIKGGSDTATIPSGRCTMRHFEEDLDTI